MAGNVTWSSQKGVEDGNDGECRLYLHNIFNETSVDLLYFQQIYKMQEKSDELFSVYWFQIGANAQSNSLITSLINISPNIA